MPELTWLCRIGLHWWRPTTTTTVSTEEDSGVRLGHVEQKCRFCGELRWRQADPDGPDFDHWRQS